jgi:hypothetical protein
MSPTKSLGSGAHLFPIKVTLVCLLSALFITAADCHETLRARQGVNRAHRISTVVFDGAVNETVVGFVNGTVEYIYQYSLNASVVTFGFTRIVKKDVVLTGQSCLWYGSRRTCYLGSYRNNPKFPQGRSNSYKILKVVSPLALISHYAYFIFLEKFTTKLVEHSAVRLVRN